MTVTCEQRLLYRVGTTPLEKANEDAKSLAELLWFTDYRPTMPELTQVRSEMASEEFQRLLCVLELLSQYPVCPRDKAARLQQLTRRFHSLLLGNKGPQPRGRYSPSKRWKLSDKTEAFRKALLPMQTRTYADSTGRHHGLSI